MKIMTGIKNSQYRKGIYYTFYTGIILVLLFSAITKILNPAPFIETIKNLYDLDKEIIAGLAAIFPMFELLLAVLLLFRVKGKQTLMVVTLLFLFFLLVAIYGSFFLKLNNDCGCFGSVVKSNFGWGIVIRNLLFFCVSVITFFMKLKNVGSTNTSKQILFFKSQEINL